MSDEERSDCYRRDYSGHSRNWRSDPELVRRHHAALTVLCRHCQQPPGQPCVHCDNLGAPTTEPLINLPCHPVRETDSKGLKQL
ncbi:hypothetical protein LV457_02740 [Mycobacterium sp. MYCO198283]|uniref:hypothetical protein n=1 Tax=Mycobacterium sp. MYCO198283 TaxID=2883505 RepID=UPI001E4A2F34|nr:hypothetical protein [Mycobacterium sp. MYCO198283]MCG5431207.1 hypothetical protein [Mycobacterium sp. MYCO198283]